MADTERWVGRTTQAVAECRGRAAKGEKVAYISADYTLSDHCVALFDWTGWRRLERHRFLHPSGGELRFMSGDAESVSQRLRGARLSPTYDHLSKDPHA